MAIANANRALLTDLYELTMAAAYFEHNVRCRATFELFVRHTPPERSYLVAAGLDSVLGYLENLRFNEEDVRFLSEHPAFRTVSPEFFDYLQTFRFTGEVHAIPEGTLVFGNEPLVQVTAPVLEAQIVETYLLSAINFETLVASKAARVVTAASGRPVWEFGTRRAQGPQAGVRAARAAYVGGCAGTSNVLAGYLYGVPLAGTAAHSWTQIFPTERESFEALVDTFPDSAILLIDTYDTLEGARTAATLGRKIKGVRLDSGDVLEKSRQVREILDAHGLHDTLIFASGDLNEFKIAELVRQGACVDAFGVGTDLATSRDVPALGVIYKLVEAECGDGVEPKTKFSEHKAYWPGRKQVFRFSRPEQSSDRAPMFHHDLIACAGEEHPDAEPLLELVMQGGRRIDRQPRIEEMRTRTLAGLDRLPQRYQSLINGERYPVAISARLERLLEEVRKRYVTPEAARAGSVPAEAGMSETLVFLDVDTQVDFILPTGALYVPGAETIVPNLKRLMTYARENHIPVLASADAHPPDDPSFAQWPPHCVVGTPGQERIPETRLAREMVIRNRPGDFKVPADWAAPLAIEIEKTAYSVADNPNFEALLAALMAALGPSHFVVFGVATEFCVHDSVMSLRRLDVPVALVTDAIRGITGEGERKAIDELVAAGVRLVTTDEVLSGALQPRVAVGG
jgi:nicotinate phosphoribosyltransferase